MGSRKKKSQDDPEQSARFREAAKQAGGDAEAFERAFKKIVPQRKKPKAR